MTPPFGFGSIQAATFNNWDGEREIKEPEKLIADLTEMLGSPHAEEELKRKSEEEEFNKIEKERNQQAAEGPVNKEQTVSNGSLGIIIMLLMKLVNYL